MADLIIRDLDPAILETLRARAAARSRSVEEEVARILTLEAYRSEQTSSTGLGTRLMERLRDCDFEGAEIRELRGGPPWGADLEA
ncbi:MAG: hypothetical protein AAGI22_04535 [Planctomycetota bacterium]